MLKMQYPQMKGSLRTEAVHYGTVTLKAYLVSSWLLSQHNFAMSLRA